MLLEFKDCKDRFGSVYQIEKAIAEHRLFKMDVGVYSDTGDESEIEILLAKYPTAIATLESDYFHYDMADYIPERYALATRSHVHAIHDERIRQYYVSANVLDVGKSKINYDGFDMYYLSQSVKRKKLKSYVVEFVYASKRCKISTHDELVRMIRLVFGKDVFVRKFDNTRVNWLDVSPREMLDSIATFLDGLK